jgi:polyhydroxyalkanoate synthesis regulator phasin
MSHQNIELAKKVFLSGLGIAALAKEKVEVVVNELVQRGDVTKKDAEGIVEALVKKGQEAEDDLQKMIRGEITKIMDEIGIATKKDLHAVEEKIKAISSLKQT